ncbi:MAG: energy-coupling factor transporter ATPase [Deltaproteobacteria bacterium]|nr:energy-coupling factor transporter ATPase [Deltaproteobacteria bacterium]
MYHPGTPLETRALEGVCLEIAEGEGVGIVGETGSGKTSLIQHFNGLLRPTTGRIRFGGLDPGSPGLPLPELRRQVGLLFQFPEHQLFEETVFREISFVLRQGRGVSSPEIERRVEAACAAVGLELGRFRDRSPFELSGGEMRRVALASILVQEPLLLVLDEPTAGLDGPGRREILEEVGRLRRSGKTVVIVSHSLEDLLTLVDRWVVLEKGKVLVSGPSAEVFPFLLGRERLAHLVPFPFRLGRDLQAAGWNIPPLYRAEEAVAVLDKWLKGRGGAGGRN